MIIYYIKSTSQKFGNMIFSYLYEAFYAEQDCIYLFKIQ